jgi:uncharacterized protein (DUF2252 family)
MDREILTREKRMQLGKDLREKCSRSRHAEWSPSLRSWNPIDLIETSNKDRIESLVAIRYQRMLESPFKFFRGAAIIQTRDLFNSPISGIIVQACGDCHLLNFGGLATPERNLDFDINDFDETIPGPWEWDIKRLVVSFALAARELSFSKNIAEEAVRTATYSYRIRMSEFAGQSILERWYAKISIENLLEFFHNDKDFVERLRKEETRAAARTSETLFPKITRAVKGHFKILDEPPLIYHFRKANQYLERQGRYLDNYKASLQEDKQKLFDHYCIEDTAIKVVGIGSVGTRCLVSLFLADGKDPLFLQIKEARKSILENPDRKSRFENQGYRVVHGQRLMQAASDIFLGWFRSDSGHDYYVRQLHDMKISAQVESFNPQTLLSYAKMCGWALARAHAKVGDAEMIAGYLGSKDKFDVALVQYAKSYADQVELDFKAFKEAVRSGRLGVKTTESGLKDFEI